MADPTESHDVARRARLVAAKVAGTYAVVTAVWILGSGYAVSLFPFDVAQKLEIWKGLAFAVVTTVLLYITIHQWAVRFADQVSVAALAERRLLQVVRAVPAGVVLTDDAGVIEFANPEAVRIVGIPSKTMVGMRLDDVIESTESDSGIVALLASEPFDGLGIRARGDGAEGAFIATAARLVTGSRPTGWVLAFADVTGAYQEHERVRRLERGYRVLSEVLGEVQTSHDTRQLLDGVCGSLVADGLISGVWAATFDPASGGLVTASRLGLPDAMVQRIEHLVRDNDALEVFEVQQSLRSREIYVVDDMADDPRAPFAGLDFNDVPFLSSASFEVTGPEHPLAAMVFFSAEPGYFDAEQIRLIELLRDAVEFAVGRFELEAKRLAAEESLVVSENAYRQMFELNPEPMWVYDRATLRFLAVNKSAVRKYGYTEEEFLAMTIIDIRPPEDLPRLLHTVAHQSEGRQDAGFWTHIDKKGRNFAVRVRSVGINWYGVDAQLVSVEEVARVE